MKDFDEKQEALNKIEEDSVFTAKATEIEARYIEQQAKLRHAENDELSAIGETVPGWKEAKAACDAARDTYEKHDADCGHLDEYGDGITHCALSGLPIGSNDDTVEINDELYLVQAFGLNKEEAETKEAAA